MGEELMTSLDEAERYIAQRTDRRPSVGVVLGSGLGSFAGTLMEREEVPYSEIPHFPRSTVEGHAGKMVIGRFESTDLAVMAGRVHAYEGYPASDVVFPVRVLARLGIRTLLLTNAAGAVNTSFTPGDLMVLSDHVNLTGNNPLIGKNDPNLGPRFPDMSFLYDDKLQEAAVLAGRRIGLPLRKGVYAGVLGPSFETPAEIRMLRTLGADAVGMSTVWEAIAAHHMGVRIAGLSCISNMAAGVTKNPLSHQEVVDVGKRVRGVVIELFGELVPAFDKLS